MYSHRGQCKLDITQVGIHCVCTNLMFTFSCIAWLLIHQSTLARPTLSKLPLYIGSLPVSIHHGWCLAPTLWWYKSYTTNRAVLDLILCCYRHKNSIRHLLSLYSGTLNNGSPFSIAKLDNNRHYIEHKLIFCNLMPKYLVQATPLFEPLHHCLLVLINSLSIILMVTW